MRNGIGKDDIHHYLVEDGSHLDPVVPDGEKRLLVVVRGDVEDEKVNAAARCSEHASFGIHSSARVTRAALKT